MHGYRSAMGLGGGEDNVAWEVMEKALAHRVGGGTEAATSAWICSRSVRR